MRSRASGSYAEIASLTILKAFSCFSASLSLEGLLQLRNVCSQSIANCVPLSKGLVKCSV